MIDYNTLLFTLIIIIGLLSLIGFFVFINKREDNCWTGYGKEILCSVITFISCVGLLFSINSDVIKASQYGQEEALYKKILDKKISFNRKDIGLQQEKMELEELEEQLKEIKK